MTDRSWLSKRRIPAMIVAFIITLICIMWVSLYNRAQDGRQQQIDNANREMEIYARLFEAQTDQKMQQLDLLTLLIKREVETTRPSLDLAKSAALLPPEERPFLQLSVYDATGDLLASNLVPYRTEPLANHPGFLAHKAADNAAMSINRPLGESAGEKPAIGLMRRINKPDGSFGGVAAVFIDPTYFLNFYSYISHNKLESIALLDSEGFVLGRRSIDGIKVGLDFRQRIVGEMAGAETGNYTDKSIVGGEKRIFSYRKLRSYPLIVTVGVGEAQVLESLNRRMVVYVWQRGILTALAILFSAILLVALARRNKAEELLRRHVGIQMMLKEIVESAVLTVSLDEFYARIHNAVARVLPAQNFYIALVDKTEKQLWWPYCMNELSLQLCKRPIGNGLTEYVMRQEQVFWADQAKLKFLQQSGEVSPVSVPIQEYLGASLKDSSGESIGVVAVVSLGHGPRFKLEDAELFAIIAAHISLAIGHKHSEAEVVAVNQRIVEASEAKTKFLASMSHELRTPLNAIIGFSEVLQDQIFGPLNKKQKTYMANIVKSGKHLLSLINDILDISKVESGKMQLELENVNIMKLCQDLIAIFRIKAKQQQVVLSYDVAPDLRDESVVVDRRKIKQVLYNLVDNGIKFNHPGGSVSITVGCERVQGNQCTLKIAVEDTGIGIDETDMAKLFKPFSQLATPANYEKNTEGTGLGLVLARQIVELHGGNIALQSVPGQGSRFTVSLPICPVAL